MKNYHNSFYNIGLWLHFLFQLVDERNFKGMNEVHAGMKPKLPSKTINEIEQN